ncbi:hypothetical protein [Ponticoccus litoralis]
MSDLYWPTDTQMAGLAPVFPKSHDKPVLGAITFTNRYDLRWRDVPM